MDNDEDFIKFTFGEKLRVEDTTGSFSASQSILALLREQRLTADIRTAEWHHAVQRALRSAYRLRLGTLPASIIFAADMRIQQFCFECMKVMQDGFPRHDDIRELMCPKMPLDDEDRSLLYPWTTLSARNALRQYDNAVRHLIRATTGWFEIYNQLVTSLQTICRSDAFLFVHEKLIIELAHLACELDYDDLVSASTRQRFAASSG